VQTWCRSETREFRHRLSVFIISTRGGDDESYESVERVGLEVDKTLAALVEAASAGGCASAGHEHDIHEKIRAFLPQVGRFDSGTGFGAAIVATGEACGRPPMDSRSPRGLGKLETRCDGTGGGAQRSPALASGTTTRRGLKVGVDPGKAVAPRSTDRASAPLSKSVAKVETARDRGKERAQLEGYARGKRRTGAAAEARTRGYWGGGSRD